MPAHSNDKTGIFTASPQEYEAAIFWDVNEIGESKGSIIQIVARYSADDIDTMFDTSGWAFVPASGLEEIVEDKDVRVKVLTYSEGEVNTSIGLLVAKKDIAVIYAYSSSAKFNPDVIFSLARDIIQDI